MEQKVVFENNVAFLPCAKAVATSFKKNQDAVVEQVVIPKDYSTSPWSPWGDDNLFPQNVLSDLEKNSIALRALEKRKTVHYGRGIMAYRDKGKDNLGAPVREQVTDPEVVEFLRLNRLNFQWIDLIGSLEVFANGWLEFILNKGQDRINRVFVKDPAYCRNGKMDASIQPAYHVYIIPLNGIILHRKMMARLLRYPCSILKSMMVIDTRNLNLLILSFKVG